MIEFSESGKIVMALDQEGRFVWPEDLAPDDPARKVVEKLTSASDQTWSERTYGHEKSPR